MIRSFFLALFCLGYWRRPPAHSLSWRLGFWWCHCVEHQLQMFCGYPTQWWARPVRWLGDALYYSRRWLQGARKIRTGEPFEATDGSFAAHDCEIQFSGACPVQGEGWVTDSSGMRRECYYRSRGEGWQFHVAPIGGDIFDDGEWVYSESRYFFPDGGYVTASVSCDCISRALDKWRAAQ